MGDKNPNKLKKKKKVVVKAVEQTIIANKPVAKTEPGKTKNAR